MSENKNYVSNNEVHSAFGGDSKIKYLKEKIIAICAVLVLIIGGIIFYTSQKQEKPLKAKNDAGMTMEDSTIEEVDSPPITTYDDNENFNADTTNIIKEPQVQNDNTNPNPEIEKVAEVVKPKNINASFIKIGQNKVQWSDDLKNNTEKITIVFDNGFKKYIDDVTNKNTYLFESGDKDFDGVECTVTLETVLKSNVKLIAKPKLKLKTHC